MKLVKERSTNKYMQLSQEDFDANPELYVDRSDRPAYWLKHHSDAGFSYLQSRYYVKELVDNATNGIDDFNTADKDAIGIYFYGDKNKLATHYVVVNGLTAEQAQGKLLQDGSVNFSMLAKDAKAVVASPKMMAIGMQFLTTTVNGETDSTQADNFISAIQDFLNLYTTRGLLGLSYSDDREGLMDYIESTGSYVGAGLENYTLNPDMVTVYGSEENARNAMIAQLQDLFVKGNY